MGGRGGGGGGGGGGTNLSLLNVCVQRRMQTLHISKI